MKKLLYLIVILFAGIGVGMMLYPALYLGRSIPFIQRVIQQPVVNEESAITKTVQKTLPSVVTIGIDTLIDSVPIIEFNPNTGSFQPSFAPAPQKEVKQNIGSGFIVTSDGLIVTNKHVVQDSQATYTVLTNDGKKYPVVNIYRDPVNDLAVLKINATGLKPLPFGNSSQLQLGQTVIAIGTTFGEFQNTVTTGVVSGLGRGILAGSDFQLPAEQLNNVIQTDAPINPGNSGGPLLDVNGNVIGINTAIVQGGQNVGFAIPVNTIVFVMNSFNTRGFSYHPPYIGIRYFTVTAQDNQNGISNQKPGAYIKPVSKFALLHV